MLALIMGFSPKRIRFELANLLKTPDRDFQSLPITREESQALIEKLFEIIKDSKTPQDLLPFYIRCLDIVKENTVYN